MRKILLSITKNVNFWPVVVVIFFGILASRSLLFQSGYFNMHDDLQMMRQLEMEKCFLDLQIPCRWIPDMGYGYGFPLFNFYPPLPYLIGEVFRIFGLSFITTVKLTFSLAFILSGVSMYFLVKEFFGKLGGVVSAVFYIWAPYHSVDVYVRGAMNESWALVFFPVIFLTGYKLIVKDKKEIFKWGTALSLAYFGLFTSHNLMVLIFTPFFAVWILIWLWISKSWTRLIPLAVSGIYSLALSAYFTLPAIFENKFTWLKSQLSGYYDYTAHFVTINQLLFSRFWGYGPSVWLEEDGMSFQAGHAHWILSLIIVVCFLYLVFVKKKFKKLLKNNVLLIVFFLFGMGWVSAFMTHLKSIYIYQTLDFIGIVQFPWRFLTLVIFAFSFLAGAIVTIIKNPSVNRRVAALLIILLLALNWKYFTPQNGRLGKLTDKEKFTGAAWDLQRTAGIYDYLPLTAKEAPKAPRNSLAEVMGIDGNPQESQTSLTKFDEGTSWARFTYESTGKGLVRVNIFDFPGWEVKIDGNKVEKFIPETEKWGRMYINIPEGRHDVLIRFTNTPIRNVSNMVSFSAWLLLAYLLIFRNKFKNVKYFK